MRASRRDDDSIHAMGAMMEPYTHRYDVMSGEWMGEAEDYHPSLPEYDPPYEMGIAALAVICTLTTIVAVVYCITWGLPR
jgi:hypothetical protein